MKNDECKAGDIIDVEGTSFEVVENKTNRFTCSVCREVNKCTACPFEIIEELTGKNVGNDCVSLLPIKHYPKKV